MIVENEAQLESYKPIPSGGAKLLVVLMFATLCSVLHILGISWITINIPSEDHGVWVVGLGFAVCVSVALVIWAAYIIMGKNPKVWLGEYFQRNVRGRRIWYRLDDENQVVREVSRTLFDYAFYRALPRGKMHLELYLGGWFKRPSVMRGEHGPQSLRATVRVKQHEDPADVTLIDMFGNRMYLFIEYALGILRHSDSPRNLDLSMVVKKLMVDLSATKQLNRQQSREFNGLKIKRDAMLLDLQGIIDQIQDTSRFGKSKEAHRLREQMEKQLLYYLPEDDPRRPSMERQIAEREQREPSGQGEEEEDAQEASEA